MWDRLLTDCNVATMDPAVPAPFGTIENASIGIQDGRIVRVGRRTELAGFRAREVVPLGGALVTPGLIDCHTHLIFGGNLSAGLQAPTDEAAEPETAYRRGVTATVAATRASSSGELIAAARQRLRALVAGGVTSVEVKSGYGLDSAHEMRLLNVARSLMQSEPVRIVPTLLALHALPPEYAGRRGEYLTMVCEEMLPAITRAGLAQAVDACCGEHGFAPAEIRQLFEAAEAQGLPVKIEAERFDNGQGAALAAACGALSASHLGHLDDVGASAMARAGMVAVLLPGEVYAQPGSRKPSVDLLRRHGVPIAIATGCDPATSPVLNPSLMLSMARTLLGLTPEEALAGMTREAARALGLRHLLGTISSGKIADLCVWSVGQAAELCYWIGHPGPERRILAGEDA